MRNAYNILFEDVYKGRSVDMDQIGERLVRIMNSIRDDVAAGYASKEMLAYTPLSRGFRYAGIILISIGVVVTNALKYSYQYLPVNYAESILLGLGTGILLASVLMHLAGSMDLFTCLIMIISSYLIYAQLDNAGTYSALLRSVDVCVTQANEILATPQMDISGEDIIPESCELRADNITFAYEHRNIINGISLTIPQKTTTAIVGPSGGGKTTLTSLLSRFWDVDSGTVTLGGTDVRRYSMDSLMKNFSFVFQRVYLFEDTIANNIRFGQPQASMEKVIEAAKKACCHDFIMQLPNGYDTVIGEGGASLSGGEKQRISIARAIMKDAPIIVLDEATANVDPENEADLIGAIDALTKEKTIIMIAHRLKTVRKADNILVIESGKIAQQGTHEQLMAQEGIYRTFVDSRREAASWRL
jgi:ATP-binding cassette subfamily B protein